MIIAQRFEPGTGGWEAQILPLCSVLQDHTHFVSDPGHTHSDNGHSHDYLDGGHTSMWSDNADDRFLCRPT